MGINPLFYWVITLRALEIKESVKASIEPQLESMGYEVVDIEYRREPVGMVLRVYIDQPSGVRLEDCAKASNLINSLLDEGDIIEGSYSLEVSSPGIERRLTKVSHYERFKGQKILVKTKRSIDGRRKYKGKLTKVDDSGFSIEFEGDKVDLSYSQVLKANLVFTGEKDTEDE